MLKLLVICALLSAFQHEAIAEKIRTAAREISLHDAHTYTVAIESHLFTIAKNKTHLFVNSTDPNFHSCSIAFEDHSIQGRIEATTIDRKIIVWGIRAKYETDIGDRIDHTILIVNPWQCDFKAASTFEEERVGWPNPDENLARVVAHNNSFDVFYPSLQTCAPCRYSIDGKRIDLQHQLEVNRTLDGVYTFFRIQSYNVPGHGKGYFYAQNIGMESSVINILDENFRVMKQRSFEHMVDRIAANSNASPNVHVCYMTQLPWRHNDNDTICCEQFDADLKLLHTIHLPMIPGHAPDALSMSVNASDDLFVAAVQSLPQDRTIAKFGYYWVGSNGQLIDSATIYELPNDDVYGRWRIRGFFADSKYCIENTNDEHWQDHQYEFVKCFVIPLILRDRLESSSN